MKLWIFSGHTARFKIETSKVQDFRNFELSLIYFKMVVWQKWSLETAKTNLIIHKTWPPGSATNFPYGPMYEIYTKSLKAMVRIENNLQKMAKINLTRDWVPLYDLHKF